MRSMNLLWVTIFLCINTIAQVKFDRNGIQTTMSSEDSAKAITQDTLKNLTITHLIGDYFIFTTYKLIQGSVFPSNGMYVVTDIGVVLFDTPWDTSQFQPLLDSIEFRHHKKVISSISTHFHDDRTAAVNYYNDKGIKTHSSKLTFDLCKEKGENQPAFYFDKDTTFNFGKHLFQTFYPGEGHSKDNIVIWCPNEKILYGGCLVKSTENNNLGYINDANLEEWPHSVKKVIKKFLNPVFVIPGHFGWGSKRGLQHTLKLLKK